MEEPKKIEHEKRLLNSKQGYKAIGDLWSNWKTVEREVIRDFDDNVERCIRCGWEIFDGACVHCLTIYNHSRGNETEEDFDGASEEEEFHSSDDGFIVNDDEVEFESDGDLFHSSGRREARLELRGSRTDLNWNFDMAEEGSVLDEDSISEGESTQSNSSSIQQRRRSAVVVLSDED
jgi:hypothetical protein